MHSGNQGLASSASILTFDFGGVYTSAGTYQSMVVVPFVLFFPVYLFLIIDHKAQQRYIVILVDFMQESVEVNSPSDDVRSLPLQPTFTVP